MVLWESVTQTKFVSRTYCSTIPWRRQRNAHRRRRQRCAPPLPRKYRSKKSKERTFIAMQNKSAGQRCSRGGKQSGTRTETSSKLLLSRKEKARPNQGACSPIGGGLVRIRVPQCLFNDRIPESEWVKIIRQYESDFTNCTRSLQDESVHKKG